MGVGMREIKEHEGISFLAPRLLKRFSCSTELSMIFLLINVKMPTIVGTDDFNIYKQEK